ncbi:alpha/beta hydrolase [Hymenobacter defluvii]|uniref:Alpha/beta hydrolase n=1 Tax=Hymenobacter defluvii TaxID=2054411 RepID=A0ABS3T7E6_9BACT|nr:alpha/beta hydrolase [Hymenobacter defluvii]MBO3269560.1 alpha/beta hydrolase [Hymenobacter defluvii]
MGIFCCKRSGWVLVLGLLLASWASRAQTPTLARDTSFTVYSALAKARKTDPTITLAQPVVPATIHSQTNVPYCTASGRALQLDVFYPKARRRGGYPAVLLIHGGGWRSGDRSQHVPMAQQLAARGFVAVTAEYRLSTEAPYPAAVLDLKAAVRWMRAHAREYHLNPKQIASWGFSAGGQLAALVGTTNEETRFDSLACNTGYSSQVQAIVDVDGILAFIHPESGEGDDRKSISAATYWFGSSKTERPALWRQASALTYVGPRTPPTLFLNSSVDRMHAGRDDMMQQLSQFNIYHEVHTFPDAPHPFPLFNPWFAPTLDYTVAFLNKVFSRK